MTLKNYLKLGDYQLKRLKNLYEDYKKLYTDPDNCTPKFIVNVPVKNQPTWEERLEDPITMLKTELDALRPHLEIEDDRVPSVRVQFGTAQVAAAYGCEIFIPNNSLPSARSHVLEKAEDVYELEQPGLEDGWYGKLKEFTDIWIENLPEGIHIQHPDIQSPFNNAHLIRGNDIFTDFYDRPELVEELLDRITDYMIKFVPYLKKNISDNQEWFFDWGAMWKGVARISNCSAHMISADFYSKYVLPRDIRLLKSIGGGRVHYCGTADEVIDEFFKNPVISGLDYDSKYHELWSLAERAPKRVSLLYPLNINSKTGQRLLAGDWPDKRNIIIITYVENIEEGKDILQKLKSSVSYMEV